MICTPVRKMQFFISSWAVDSASSLPRTEFDTRDFSCLFFSFFSPVVFLLLRAVFLVYVHLASIFSGGGVCGWDFKRILISRGANFLGKDGLITILPRRRSLTLMRLDTYAQHVPVRQVCVCCDREAKTLGSLCVLSYREDHYRFLQCLYQEFIFHLRTAFLSHQ